MTPHYGLDPDSTALLNRTRSAVMSLLAIDGLLIGLSGLLLRSRGPGITLWPVEEAYRWSHLSLLGLMFAGSIVRLIGTSRPVLEDPGRRTRRFFWAHTLSALIGTAALPLGLAYAWAVRPMLVSIAPFWVVSLVLGLLSLPRLDELIGFDRPLPDRSHVEPDAVEDPDSNPSPSRT